MNTLIWVEWSWKIYIYSTHFLGYKIITFIAIPIATIIKPILCNWHKSMNMSILGGQFKGFDLYSHFKRHMCGCEGRGYFYPGQVYTLIWVCHAFVDFHNKYWIFDICIQYPYTVQCVGIWIQLSKQILCHVTNLIPLHNRHYCWMIKCSSFYTWTTNISFKMYWTMWCSVLLDYSERDLWCTIWCMTKLY